MSVVIIVESIGSSPKELENATKNALDEAAKTIDNIKTIKGNSCEAVQCKG